LRSLAFAAAELRARALRRLDRVRARAGLRRMRRGAFL